MNDATNVQKGRLPDIYQVEVASACNLVCPMCIRDDQHNALLDMDLVRLIVDKYLGNSFYVELQMRGEPLIHSRLEEIVKLFKTKVMTGFSTNLALPLKETHLVAMSNLDALTVSVDSIRPELNAKYRAGRNLDLFLGNIEKLMTVVPDTCFVDFQTIKMAMDGVSTEGEDQVFREWAEKQPWASRKNWLIRTVEDGFINMRDGVPVTDAEMQPLCINPFVSVSVQADGDVVPCCQAFGKDLVFGNLHKEPLESIWASPRYEEFREAHRRNVGLPKRCQECYMRSPWFIHLNILKNHLKKERA